MNLVIPGNLAGGGGVGDAMRGAGEKIQGVGKVLDIVQSNFDYNDATAIKREADLKKQDHFINFWQREDGSDPKAMDRYTAGLDEIDKEYNDRAFKLNGRVGGFAQKDNAISTATFSGEAQKTHYVKFYNKSKETDRLETSDATKRAITTGQFDAELESNMLKLNGRRAIYGDNTDKVIKEENAFMTESFILGRLSNPVTAADLIKRFQDDPEFKQKLYGYLPADKIDGIEKAIQVGTVVASQRQGIDIGVEVFKTDTTGSIENMTDAIRAQKLDVETEKAAINQVKELFNERNVDKQTKEKNAEDGANAILVPLALKRKDGLNRMTDLSGAQWAALTAASPKYAAKLQDGIRREQDMKTRADRAEGIAWRQEKRLRQQDNESKILISPDFDTRDLKRDLAVGDIDNTQYLQLLGMQTKMNPIKRDSVRGALKKIETGSALKSALGVSGKNDEAIWKQQYGDLVKAWAYNHKDDPNFDANLSKFVEEKILTDMTTSWFSFDSTDRLRKYNQAKSESGDLPAKYRNPVDMPAPVNVKKYDTLPPAGAYKGKIATDDATGKKYKSDGKNWIEIKGVI